MSNVISIVSHPLFIARQAAKPVAYAQPVRIDTLWTNERTGRAYPQTCYFHEHGDFTICEQYEREWCQETGSWLVDEQGEYVLHGPVVTCEVDGEERDFNSVASCRAWLDGEFAASI